MCKLVKNKTGLSIVEILVGLGISSIVGLIAVQPVLNFHRKVQKTMAAHAFISAESDIFYLLANNGICTASLSGINSASATNISAIRRTLPPSAGGGYQNLISIGQQIHPLVHHLKTFAIKTQPLVPTGTAQGLVQVDFDFRSASSPELNKVRSFVVKVLTDISGAVVGCARGTAQELSVLCRSFSSTFNAAGRCQNLIINGTSAASNTFNVNLNLSGGTLSSTNLNVGNSLSVQTYSIANALAVTATTTGTSPLNIVGGFTANNFISTNLVCASGSNCRSFAPVFCGSSAYISMIDSNGAVNCMPRPW